MEQIQDGLPLDRIQRARRRRPRARDRGRSPPPIYRGAREAQRAHAAAVPIAALASRRRASIGLVGRERFQGDPQELGNFPKKLLRRGGVVAKVKPRLFARRWRLWITRCR